MITDADDVFARGCGRCPRFATPDCSTRRWKTGLRALRGLCLGAGLTETVKWAHPCYMHADRNFALISAFRDDFRLAVFNTVLTSEGQRSHFMNLNGAKKPETRIARVRDRILAGKGANEY